MSSAVISPATRSLEMTTVIDVGRPQTLTVVRVSTTLIASNQHWRKPEQDCGSELVTFDIGPTWVSNLCSRSPYSRSRTAHTRAPTTSLHPLTPAVPISNPDKGNKDCSNWLTIGLPIIFVTAVVVAMWWYVRRDAIRRQYQRRPLEENEMVNPYINVPPQGASGDVSQESPDVNPAQKVESGVSHPDTAAGKENMKKKKTTMKKGASTQPPPIQPPPSKASSSKATSSKNSSSENTSDKDLSTTASNSSAERRRQAQNAAKQNPISLANRRRGNPTIRPVASDQPSFPPRAARRNATVADEGSVSSRGTFSNPSGRRNAMSDEPQSPRGTSGIDWNTDIFDN